MSDIFFSSTDVYDRKVVLEQSQLENHIIEQSAHIEIADDPDCIQRTVEDPDYIYDSSKYKERDVYFGRGKHKDYKDDYVKVIVDFTDPNLGNVISAWVTDEVSTSIGGLKYEKKFSTQL